MFLRCWVVWISKEKSPPNLLLGTTGIKWIKGRGFRFAISVLGAPHFFFLFFFPWIFFPSLYPRPRLEGLSIVLRSGRVVSSFILSDHNLFFLPFLRVVEGAAAAAAATRSKTNSRVLILVFSLSLSGTPSLSLTFSYLADCLLSGFDRVNRAGGVGWLILREDKSLQTLFRTRRYPSICVFHFTPPRRRSPSEVFSNHKFPTLSRNRR